MFKSKPSSTTPSSKQQYAFSQPNTANNSSQQVKSQERETFYQPLPVPSPGSSPSLPPHTPNTTNNPFADPTNRDYISRTPSPLNASNPLLPRGNNNNQPYSPASPAYSSGSMPNPSRSYGPRAVAAGMPQRGDSQSALLGNQDYRQQPQSRRYGPTASAAPIPANASLLGSPAQSVVSSDKALGAGVTHGNEAWGAGMEGLNPEADDYLHNPDPKRDRRNDRGGTIFTARGLSNIGCLALLLLGIIALFAGYPIISHYTEGKLATNGAYNLGGINSTGQVPKITNFVSVIDPDTPQSVYTRTGFDKQPYTLVFSDEFNKDGRTFYPGDDPYWTAVDIHYWPTGDFEWYDPSAITTKDGHLQITMTQEPIHDLNFKSGMLQSWNQMCFQYSTYIEVSVSLPGDNVHGGFWPGVWMMGNLGRPGYGATTDGTWPYTYASCDVGTLKNQTTPDGSGPLATISTGAGGGGLSYLPGQRMSACTCPGEDHAGPDVSVGRGVPEIDVIEAQLRTDLARGQVSQSAQIAPFDDYYQFNNASTSATTYNTDLTYWNTYLGGSYQQAASALTYVPNNVYQLTGAQFNTYGFEYYTNPSARSSGHITWVSSGTPSWTLLATGMGPNPRVGVGQRLIAEEPMSMIINFGMSNNFQTVQFADLKWPAKMLVDYVRVYQRSDGKMGCDPADRPTAAYIASHANAYANPNLTTWEAAGYTRPKNSLLGC